MQTARGVTDVAAEVINAGVFATTTTFAMVAMAGLIDPGMMVIFLAWVVAYAMILRYFLPRIRVRAKTRAGGAGAGHRADCRCVDQHQNRQTVRPRRLRGPRRVECGGQSSHRRHPLGRAGGAVSLYPDPLCRCPARLPDRLWADAMVGGRGQRGRAGGGRRDVDSAWPR